MLVIMRCNRFQVVELISLNEYAFRYLDKLEEKLFVISASLSSPLDMFTAIKPRRAIKSFKEETMPPEMLQRLVELTGAASSSDNLPDWQIILVQSAEQK